MTGAKYTNRQLLTAAISIAFGMLMLAYASVPLYKLFCKVTGFGGTPQIAVLSSPYIGSRTLTISFDANVEPNLPWSFAPSQNKMTIRTGEHALAFYTAENHSDEAIVGMAIYNVTPNKAGKYFNKIDCFCFDERRIEARQKQLLPVAFFIDPALDNDPALKDVRDITLSYSFFRYK